MPFRLPIIKVHLRKISPVSWPINGLAGLLYIFLLTQPTYASTKLVAYPFQQQEMSLEEVIWQLQRDRAIDFIYLPEEIRFVQHLRVEIDDRPALEIIRECVKGTGLTVSESQGTIIISAPSEELLLKIQVVDEENAPLPFAVIKTIPNDQVLTTDIEGWFELSGQYRADSLEVSAIGFKSRSIAIDNIKDNRIVLPSSNYQLEEVQVYGNGYFELPKERSTGAYGSVKSSNIENTVVQNIGSVLEGNIPGIQVFEDAQGNIELTNTVIRGVGTIDERSEKSPLLVVDGFPISLGFQTINPKDIASITILKDAAAASIWGARAGNGVIVIQTKTPGTFQKWRVNYSHTLSNSTKPDLAYNLNFSTPEAQLEYERRLYQENMIGFSNLPPQSISDVSKAINGLTRGAQAYYDFSVGKISDDVLQNRRNQMLESRIYEEIDQYLLRASILSQNHLDISYGGRRFKTGTKILRNQNHYSWKGNSKNQYLINQFIGYQPLSWLQAEVHMTYDQVKEASRGIDLNALRSLSSYDRILYPDGTYYPIVKDYNLAYLQTLEQNISDLPVSNIYYNPLRESHHTQLTNRQYNYRISGAFDLTFSEALTLSSSFQFEHNKDVTKEFRDEESYGTKLQIMNSIDRDSFSASLQPGPPSIPVGGILWQLTTTQEAFTLRNVLNYSKQFGLEHDFTFLLGHEIISRTWNYTANRKYGYNPDTGAFSSPSSSGGFTELLSSQTARYFYGNYSTSTINNRFLSYFANASYAFSGKYTISGSLRYDGTNYVVKDPGLRYNPMWSLGASWNLGEEAFLKDVKQLDDLILRFTIGENGNAFGTVSSFPTLTKYDFTSIRTGKNIAYITDFGNPDLRWERIRTSNLGLDMALFNRKLSVTLDLYRKYSYDLLAEVAISPTLGSTRQTLNTGEMLNKGIELHINHILPFTDNSSLSTTLTFTHNKSEVTSFDGGYISPASIPANIQYAEGYPYSPIFAYVYDGVDENNLPFIKGENGQLYSFAELIGRNGEDAREVLRYMGSRIAPTVIGFNNDIRIGQFYLRARITAKLGHYFTRTSFNYGTSAGSSFYPHSDLNLLMSPGGSADLPPVPDQYIPTYYRYSWYTPYLHTLVEDAGFIKLREIYIAYDFNTELLNRLGLNKFRLFTSVQHTATLWTANGKGIDPEFIQGRQLKPNPVFSLGLKLAF